MLLALGLLIAGAVAYRFLPIAPLPSVDIPTIIVLAELGPAPRPRRWRTPSPRRWSDALARSPA